MDIEENDEVEREIDIVYTGQFCNDTKIFQFPLIPQNSMNIENINSLNINQNNNSMKLEMKINPKYLDPNDYNAVPLHTLKGEKIESNSNLCLGMIKNNKLYLSPISQVFQFRHDFSDINKEKNIIILKKDKKEIKQLDKNKEAKEENFKPITIHHSDSIENKIILERFTSPEGEEQKANFMEKDEYFDFLLKYVITAETGADSNNELINYFQNNFSKESFGEIKNEEEKMVIEKENEKEVENKKDKKVRGFVSGLEAIKNITQEKQSSKKESSNGIIYNMINNIFEEENEAIYFDNLLENICKQMNISKDDNEKINQIVNGINESCIIVKENICFLKNISDSEINEVRNLLIKEIGNNDNGLKKQQIKKLIEQNGLSISDSKLTKLLQKICKFTGNTWNIKIPSKL